MVFPLLIELIFAVVMLVVSYALMPKPKQPKPEAAKEMDNPTAEAGREIPVLFGELTVKSPNCLWFGDKSMNEYQVKA
jgi:hypothetical protein